MSVTFLANQTIRQNFHLVTAVGYHIVHLNSGVNVISYDGALLDVTKTNIAGLLGIYYYIGTAGAEWLFYVPGWEEVNTLKSLEYGKTYTIQTSVAQDWQVPNYTEQPTPECVVNSDCPTGYVCTNGKCVKSEPPPTDLDIALHSGEIGANWWSYSQQKRLSIASYAIENYSVPLYGELQATGYGQSGCLGGPYTNIKEPPVCAQHFFLRFCIMGNSDLPMSGWGKPLSARYWRDNKGEWHCHYYPDSFKLPVFSGYTLKLGFLQHSICALLIDNNFPQDFGSWIFFQYNDTNIQPNTFTNVTADTMNPGDLALVRNVVSVGQGGWFEGNEEYSWDITEAGAVPR